jgi:hypothetical protein
MHEHYGDVVYKQIKDNVEDIAAGDIPAAGELREVDQLGALRGDDRGHGLERVHLDDAAVRLSQSIVRVGPQWIGRGLARWIRDAASMENTAGWINRSVADDA